MPQAEKSDKVLYFTGVILREGVPFDAVERVLRDKWGEIERISERFPFDQTRFYEAEMGQNLSRIFISFKNRICPALLPRLKKEAIEMEDSFLHDGKRAVNIDPGYLDAVKLVLVSTKHGGHKMAMTEEIYADLILDYFRGDFRAFDWTFPDFKSGRYFPFLKTLRDDFLRTQDET